MDSESHRLFALDESLRAEGREVLERSGIGAIIREAGYVPVGSQVMRTMTWRDLDFERYLPEPDWEENWQVGTRLAATGWCVRLNCVDVYREQAGHKGLYWGLRVADPARTEAAPKNRPTVWKMDLWTAREEEFELAARARRDALLTDETRRTILEIKEAVCRAPEYRSTLLSVHIYEAVLERGITGLAEFRRWWEHQVLNQAGQ